MRHSLIERGSSFFHRHLPFQTGLHGARHGDEHARSRYDFNAPSTNPPMNNLPARAKNTIPGIIASVV